MKCKLVGAVVVMLALFLSLSPAYAGSGTVTVTLLPAGVQATARWNASIPGVDPACPGVPCQISGATHTFNWGGGGAKNVSITLNDVPGWVTPDFSGVHGLPNGGSLNLSYTYTLAPVPTGSVSVTINPAGAVAAGAQWSVDGGAWQNSGATVSGLSVGNHTVSYKDIANWDKPADEVVAVLADATTNTSGTYIQHVGSLTVTISPAGAVAAGAQWSIDGVNWNNSGVTLNNLPVGAYTVQFSTIANWDKPANQNINITKDTNTPVTGTYVPSVGSLTFTIEPAGAIAAGALWRVDGGAWQNSGDTVNDLPVGVHVVSFFDILNWDTPADQNVDILSGATTSTTGTYIQHVGSLQVFIEPEGARNAGAQWRANGGAWQNPGAVVPNLPVGDYIIDFKTIYGWDAPASDMVSVLNGQTGDTTGTYGQQTGWLRVTLEPEAARLDGALWGFTDEPIPSRISGDIVLKFVDTYGINFLDIAGWETPGMQVVDVLDSVIVDAGARYLPKPVLLTPADGAAGVAVKPTLKAAEVGPALLPPGFVHNKSRWQISKTPAFAHGDLVLDFTDTQLTSFFADWLALAANTTYWWRVKYLDTAAALESGWADAFTFTTLAVVTPIKGDVNGDRVVSDADLKLIRALQGVRCGDPKYIAAADLDSSCRIDSIDINLWYKAYNDFKAGKY